MFWKNKSTIRVAFYIRVSTEEQVREWYGLEYQKKSLEELINFKANQHPTWVTDTKWHYCDPWCSWSDLNRPWFKEMMADAKKWKFDIVAVWKIDRLSRNLSHLLTTFEELRKSEVSFFSLKENIDFSWPVGRLTFQIFGALAEFEREMIKTRTIEWKIASAKRWNYIGYWIPYWYNRDEKREEKWTRLKIIPKEAKMLKQIFNWYLYDNYHFAKISNTLNELWIPKWEASRQRYKNTKWRQETIKDMLQNSTYMWLRVEKIKRDDWEYELIEVPVPAILSEDIFDFTQIKIKHWEENERGNKNWWWKQKYLLSRLIYDTGTKRKFIWYTRANKTEGYRRKWFTDEYWVFHWNFEIPWETLDNFVWDHILLLIANPTKFYKLFKIQSSNENDIKKIKDLNNELKEQLRKKETASENIQYEYMQWWISEKEKTILLRETTKKEKI